MHRSSAPSKKAKEKIKVKPQLKKPNNSPKSLSRLQNFVPVLNLNKTSNSSFSLNTTSEQMKFDHKMKQRKRKSETTTA